MLKDIIDFHFTSSGDIGRTLAGVWCDTIVILTTCKFIGWFFRNWITSGGDSTIRKWFCVPTNSRGDFPIIFVPWIKQESKLSRYHRFIFDCPTPTQFTAIAILLRNTPPANVEQSTISETWPKNCMFNWYLSLTNYIYHSLVMAGAHRPLTTSLFFPS